MALSIEELYKAYIDPSQDFAEDVFDWFGDPGLYEYPTEDGWATRPYSEMETEFVKQQWAKEYGMYIPTYDPTGEKMAYEDKLLSLRDAGNVYNLSRDISNRVYDTSARTARQKLDEEIRKGNYVAGDIGLRSGSLAGALEESTEKYSNMVTDLADTLSLSRDKDLNAYNKKVSEAALDYDKAAYEEKRDFYDDVMAIVSRLSDKEALKVTDVNWDTYLDFKEAEEEKHLTEEGIVADILGEKVSCADNGGTWDDETDCCSLDMECKGAGDDYTGSDGDWQPSEECDYIPHYTNDLGQEVGYMSDPNQPSECIEYIKGSDDDPHSEPPSSESCAAMPCICNDYGQQICYEYNWNSGECQGKATNDNSGCQ